jgi:hypothetical protein
MMIHNVNMNEIWPKFDMNCRIFTISLLKYYIVSYLYEARPSIVNEYWQGESSSSKHTISTVCCSWAKIAIKGCAVERCVSLHTATIEFPSRVQYVDSGPFLFTAQRLNRQISSDARLLGLATLAGLPCPWTPDCLVGLLCPLVYCVTGLLTAPEGQIWSLYFRSEICCIIWKDRVLVLNRKCMRPCKI